MVSHHLQANTAAAMAMITIIGAFFASVVGQSNQTMCSDGCLHPTGKNSCHSINKTLFYYCLSEDTHQFSPALTADHLSITCTAGIGWFNVKGVKPYEINCVKREKHCLTPPAANSSNIIIQIHGLTIDVYDSIKKELYYLEGTTAIYMRKTPQPNATDNQQHWRCTKQRTRNETIYYAWEMTTEPLHHHLPNEVSADYDDGDSSNSPTDVGLHSKFHNVSEIDRQLLRNLLLGICTFLGVVLIGLLIFLLHRYRTRPVLPK